MIIYKSMLIYFRMVLVRTVEYVQVDTVSPSFHTHNHFCKQTHTLLCINHV